MTNFGSIQMPVKRTMRDVPTLFLVASLFAAGAVMVGWCPGASAQPATAKPGGENRVFDANSADIAEGKRLADSSCSGCHGPDGITSIPGVPNLAGQRPAYLYLELKAYQNGARADSAMTDAAKFLNDDALVAVSAYFASLDPPQAAPSSGAAATDPVLAGKNAAAACAGCHGATGVSQMPGTPSLAGLDPKYLVAAMKAYKTDARKNDTMKAMLMMVDETNLDNIALYFALQKPARAPTPVAGDAAAGAATAAGCSGCHGDKGVSSNPAIPSLAGQDAQYLAAALAAYKSGSRSEETMKGLASGLDANAAKNLAAHFASLEPQPPNVRKPLSAEEWAQKCDRCHGVNGNSIDPRRPALAAQRADYLEKALRAYRTGERKSTEMAAMSDPLGNDDIKNLAAYYSRQKARAVIFVAVPGK